MKKKSVGKKLSIDHLAIIIQNGFRHVDKKIEELRIEIDDLKEVFKK